MTDPIVHERCDACGFDGARYDPASLLEALRGLGPRWRPLLASAGPELRARPEPEVWSAIEYAAHSRDITALHVYGVEQALTGEEPVFPPIMANDLIEAAAATYDAADPVDVSAELTTQMARLADLAQAAGSNAWSQGITIGDDRTDVRHLLEHALHDSLHHVGDVERGLARLRSENPGGRGLPIS